MWMCSIVCPNMAEARKFWSTGYETTSGTGHAHLKKVHMVSVLYKLSSCTKTLDACILCSITGPLCRSVFSFLLCSINFPLCSKCLSFMLGIWVGFVTNGKGRPSLEPRAPFKEEKGVCEQDHIIVRRFDWRDLRDLETRGPEAVAPRAQRGRYLRAWRFLNRVDPVSWSV